MWEACLDFAIAIRLLTTHNTILWLWFLLLSAQKTNKWPEKRIQRQGKAVWFFFWDIDLRETLARHWMNVLWLMAYASASNLALSPNPPAICQTLPLSVTLCPNAPLSFYCIIHQGLTLFCTWLTARCLKYFPVCSRINCSSGNDDSRYKGK